MRLTCSCHQPLLRHHPGQYVDLYIPNVPITGGFTITSSPTTALPRSNTTNQNRTEDQFLELAIQNSPSNPPAAFLWRKESEILNAPLSLRIGGAFTYPPPRMSQSEFSKIKNVLFIAGGVGINPIMSMISLIHETGLAKEQPASRPFPSPQSITVLYSTKYFDTAPSRLPAQEQQENPPQDQADNLRSILFFPRLSSICQHWTYQDSPLTFNLHMFHTSSSLQATTLRSPSSARIHHHNGRLTTSAVLSALHNTSSSGPRPATPVQDTLAYICGPPTMTDELVELLQSVPGMEEEGRVLCEKWW